jgi:hypothetical protein|tara:strand:+ start:7518 stop:7676 length:159 start_codon:yes stop_codon:yes gene_type:complete
MILVSSEVKKKRLAICNNCPRLFKPTKTCMECGCFMVVKATLPTAKCPKGKW